MFNSIAPDFLESTDVILAMVIMTLLVLRGHFKADSLQWWTRAARLVRSSGLCMEDKELRMESQASVNAQGEMLDRARLIAKEERRRLFWLVYCLDRHLALSFNSTLHFPDGTFCVAAPLSESLWRSLETVELNFVTIPSPSLGPLQTINGFGFFECFLPLATILGHIIELHHFHSNPVLGKCVSTAAVEEIERLLSQRQHDLAGLQQALENPQSTGDITIDQTQGHLSFMYSSCMLHVLYILLHGK